VHDGELGHGIRDVRVAVGRGGNTVRGPSSVCHRGLGEEHAGHVGFGLLSVGVHRLLLVEGGRGWDACLELVSQTGDLADVLEEDHGSVGRITVDPDTLQSSAETRGDKRDDAHRHYRTLGTPASPSRYTRHRRCTCDPSPRGRSSKQRCLEPSVMIPSRGICVTPDSPHIPLNVYWQEKVVEEGGSNGRRSAAGFEADVTERHSGPVWRREGRRRE
jgi:hypothetical protein